MLTSYEDLSKATNKTEEELRADRKAGKWDFNLPSLVEYVARSWGWLSPEEVDRLIVPQTQMTQVPTPQSEAPARAENPAPRQYAGTRTVRDNVEPSDDPYLDRVKFKRQP